MVQERWEREKKADKRLTAYVNPERAREKRGKGRMGEGPFDLCAPRESWLPQTGYDGESLLCAQRRRGFHSLAM